MSLYLSEARFQCDGDERYSLSESGVFQTHFDTPLEVYRYGMKQYGRCISRVYVDRQDACDLLEGRGARAVSVGWVFIKREKYTDCNKTYLQETWLIIEKEPCYCAR